MFPSPFIIFIIAAAVVALCLTFGVIGCLIICDKLRTAKKQEEQEEVDYQQLLKGNLSWLAAVQMERFKALNDEQKNYAISFLCGYVGMTEEGFTEPDMDHDHALWARLQLTKAIDRAIIDC